MITIRDDISLQEKSINNGLDRSILYNLKPMGLHTDLVESLTGYIARLADAHCTTPGVLIANLIAPVLKKQYMVENALRFYKKAHSINGTNANAIDFVEIFSAMTGREDLIYLTMLIYKDVLPVKGLLRQNRFWCTECYQEWKDNFEDIYEPLIWSLNPVTICTKHKKPLTDTCPNCLNQLPVLGRKSRPGFCSKCNYWLGSYSRNDDLITINEYSIWVTKNLGQLLAVAPSKKDCQLKKNAGHAIKLLIDDVFDCNIASFARNLRIAKVTAWEWYVGNSVPTIDNLLRISFSLSVPIMNLVINSDIKSVLPSEVGIRQLENNKEKINYRKFDEEKVKSALEELMEKEQARSIEKIARELGYNKALLYRHFPEQSKALSSKYKVSVKANSTERKERNRIVVRNTTTEISNLGMYPSKRRVQQKLSDAGIYWDKLVAAEWRNTLQELRW